MIPCQVCGRPRIGCYHRYCDEHEHEGRRRYCYLCQRRDGRPHDAPYVGPWEKPR